jgi:hypothetical protein
VGALWRAGLDAQPIDEAAARVGAAAAAQLSHGWPTSASAAWSAEKEMLLPGPLHPTQSPRGSVPDETAARYSTDDQHRWKFHLAGICGRSRILQIEPRSISDHLAVKLQMKCQREEAYYVSTS